jgi:uncharacterized protein (TIGR02453 family)
MITKATLGFLKDLAAHNQRAWFHGHRDRYEAARAEVVESVDAVLAGLAHVEPGFLEIDPEDCLFRIHRDTRFAKGKEPYKTNFGAFMSDRGRKVARAGYYVHVEPGGCLVAAGLYMPPGPELKAVRAALLEDAAGLRRILARPAFRKVFGKELPGAVLKTVPRGVPKDHPDADLLRHTSFAVWRTVPDRGALAPGFAKAAVRDFRVARAFVRWINRALDRAPASERAV